MTYSKWRDFASGPDRDFVVIMKSKHVTEKIFTYSRKVTIVTSVLSEIQVNGFPKDISRS